MFKESMSEVGFVKLTHLFMPLPSKLCSVFPWLLIHSVYIYALNCGIIVMNDTGGGCDLYQVIAMEFVWEDQADIQICIPIVHV
jgi:hypothetical protein